MSSRQQLYGPDELHSYSSSGLQRFSPNLWSLRKALNAESAIFKLDIRPEIEVAAGKGFKMTAYDVIYSVTQQALTATPTDRLAINSFANAAVPTVTNITVGGASFPTAINTGSQVNVVHRTVTTPAFLTTTDSKVDLELVFPCDTNTILDIFGVNILYVENP
jgi:hypothetical protein